MARSIASIQEEITMFEEEYTKAKHDLASGRLDLAGQVGAEMYLQSNRRVVAKLKEELKDASD